MKKIFFAFSILLILCNFGWAAAKIETNSYLKELQNENSLLASRVSHLEETTLLNYKHYDEILENKRSNYTDNLAVLCSVFFLGLAFIGLINFSLVRRELSREIDSANLSLRQEILSITEELRKEMANTIQETRENFNNSTQEIRKEFPQQVLSSVKNIEEKTDARFRKLEQGFELKIKILNADRCSVTGRIYEKTETYFTAALWFSRALKGYIETNIPDQSWIKVHIGRIRRNLERSSVEDLRSKYISEIEEAIAMIPDKKFKEEKEELAALFAAKKKELSDKDQ